MQLVSQAENINVFANDPRMISMKDTIYVHVNDMEYWEPELVDAIMNATRSCTGYEIQELYLHRNSVSLSKSDAQMLQERTKYVQDWMALHMPEIVRMDFQKKRQYLLSFNISANIILIITQSHILPQRNR